jgi:hypothetical protein
MAASRPTTPSNEIEILFSKKVNDFIRVNKDKDSYSKLDILPITSFADAEVKLEAWIEKQLSKVQGQRSWVTKWGDIPDSKLINIGKVIGKNYFIIERDLIIDGKPMASYRVDWSPEKGAHYNPAIRIDHKHEEAFLLRVNSSPLTPQSSNPSEDNARSLVLGRFLFLTQQSLKKNESMPDKVANDLLINCMKTSERSYFQNFGMLLRPVINAAIKAFEKHLSSQGNQGQNSESVDSSGQKIFDPSVIDIEVITSKVTQDLYELWRNPILLCIANIREGVELTNENSLDPEIAKVFILECEYARSKSSFSDFVGNKIKEIITPADAQSVPTFLNHLSDILSLSSEKRGSLNNVLTQQLLGRRKSSTSIIMQGLPSVPVRAERKSSNDDEFKAGEKKADNATSATLSTTTPAATAQTSEDTSKQIKTEDTHETPRPR